uniref:Chitin-binding type-2 domain-containing protein n=1 Tax=Clytia hemisphaerica TaxID=252671 RepID=A0A7M6DNN2_9CNID
MRLFLLPIFCAAFAFSDAKWLSHYDTKNPCLDLADGSYPLADLFAYIKCVRDEATYLKCKDNKIFDPESQKCVHGNHLSAKTFCKNREDGNYQNPWDCNRFVQCVHKKAHIISCQADGLVYDPYLDMCRDNLRCQKISLRSPIEDGDACKYLTDGNYAIRDVFKYLQCKDNKGTFVPCEEKNTIFDPEAGKCIDIKTKTPETFCQGRTNDDWVNPWDCHGFFKCWYNTTHQFKCQLPELVFNPYTDQCNYKEKYACKQVEQQGKTKTRASSKEVSSDDDACKGKADGNYPLHDVLSYLSCKKGKSTPKNCPTGSIFYPSSKECDSITKTTLTSFCKGRSDGDWQNPWNCNGYILCQSGRSIVRPCLINGFVFNPYNDVCVRSNKYPCYTVGARSGPTPKVPAILKSSLPQIKDICSNLTNGNYSTRDVLSFLQCTNGTSKMIACPKDTIYVSGNNCTAAKNINEDNFCTGRPEGNYRNPWDCHTYYVCHSGQRIHKQVCNIIVTLNYDPKYDTCEYPAQMPCKQLGKSMDPSHNVGDNKCKGKTDGTYPLRDVFSYLVCKKGKASIVNCPKGSIFFPSTKECESITKTSLPSFCQGRSDGDWQNPWNCHGYVLCQSGRSLARPCLINGFVFDPYNDVCKRSFPCQTVYSKSIMPSKLPHEVSELTVVPEKLQIKDICTGLKDGNYSTRETLKIFQCKNGTSSWIACPKDTIYVSGNNCTNSSTINEDNFCKERPEGNYRNPWDCHTYYVCHSGQRIHKQVCNYFVTLNYDPIFDNCESPLAIACPKSPKQNKLVQHKPVKDDNPCAKRVDGKYAVRDVALYLICKDHKASEGSCDKGQIFTPSNSKCVPIGQVNIKNFCVGREMGNYRNPWNCHSYITCVGPSAFERPCSIKTTLNYSPKDDLCEYPYKQKCVNITSSLVEHELKAYGPCAELPDGNYAVRDVAKYLICKNKVDSEGKCAKGQIFTPSTSKCVPIGKVDKEKFCVGREAGNYRDPWNCHNYFTCVGHISYNRPCSVKTTLNYSPLDDLCEFPSQYKCENITSVAPSPIKDENPCDGKADGVYEIRDVFRFLRCRKGKASLRNCKDGRYFSPVAGRCIRGKKVDLTTFCKGRGESNFRNPWDCHNYITCHGAQSFDRECDVHVELNYDPYHDRCEKPALFPCKELNPKDIMAEIIEAELIVF